MINILNMISLYFFYVIFSLSQSYDTLAGIDKFFR